MPELLHCPSCNFSKDECRAWCDEWNKKNAYPYRDFEKNWDCMKPVIYKDRLLNKYVIECQNCGMEVIFNMGTEDEHVKLWNELHRGK